MDILGIGPIELVFIFLIALILLGPKEMQKAGRTVGRWLRDFVSSDSWRAFRETSREIRNLPNRLMREANLEDMQKISQDVSRDVRDVTREVHDSVDLRKERFGSWGDPQASGTKAAPSEQPSGDEPENESTPPAPATEKKEADNDA